MFPIPDFTDYNDPGSCSKSHAKAGEGKSDLGIDLRLTDAPYFIFDRILDRHDPSLRLMDTTNKCGQEVDFPEPVGPVTKTIP